MTLRVSSVQVEGLELRPAFLETLSQSLIHSKSLEEATVHSTQLCAQLQALGLCSETSVTLDTPGYGLISVKIHAKNPKRLFANVGGQIGANSGSTENALLRLKNVFKGAETLEAKVSFGMDDVSMDPSTIYQFSFNTPLNADPDTNFELSMANANHVRMNSYHERINGLTAKFKVFNRVSGNHTIGYDWSWRENHSFSADASTSVLMDAGHTLKSCLFHSLVLDRRDHPSIPQSGYLLKLFHELAGPGGNIHHFKSEVEAQQILPLGKGWSLAASVRGGFLQALGSNRTRMNDRFFLGGPFSVRGFTTSGLGPMHSKDALGGDLYWASGLSLLSPLPYLSDTRDAKAHFFVNAGRLAFKDSQLTLVQHLQQRLWKPSISTGLGLLVNFGGVRVELNYCFPIVFSDTDRPKSGFQFGVGYEYIGTMYLVDQQLISIDMPPVQFGCGPIKLETFSMTIPLKTALNSKTFEHSFYHDLSLTKSSHVYQGFSRESCTKETLSIAIKAMEGHSFAHLISWENIGKLITLASNLPSMNRGGRHMNIPILFDACMQFLWLESGNSILNHNVKSIPIDIIHNDNVRMLAKRQLEFVQLTCISDSRMDHTHVQHLPWFIAKRSGFITALWNQNPGQQFFEFNSSSCNSDYLEKIYHAMETMQLSELTDRDFLAALVTFSKFHLNVPQLFETGIDIVFRLGDYNNILKDLYHRGVDSETRQEIMSAITRRIY